MRRSLRVLAVLFLVPVVVFSTSTTAGAATTGTLVFNLNLGADIPARCQVTWARTTTGVSIGAASRCDAGPDLTPYSPQPIEGDAGMYGFVLKDVGGNTCGSAPLPARDVPENDVKSVAAGLGAAFVPVASWVNCVPVTACLSYVFDGVGSLLDVDTANCVAIPIEPPSQWQPPAEMPFGDCPFGTPQGAAYQHRQTYVDAQNLYYVKDLLHLLFYDRSLANQSWSLSEREWRLDVIHSLAGTPPTRQNASASGLQIPAGSENQPTTTDATGNTMNPVWERDDLWRNNPSGLPGSHTWKNPKWEAYGMQVTTRGSLSTANIPVGYTNPGKCTFWLGPQIRVSDHPTFGYARPWGEMIESNEIDPPAEVEQPPTQVEPEPVDPDTDLGLLGAILSILRSVWNAIKGIAGAIGDVLKDLFIPDSGFMDDAFKDLRDAWADTTIFNFADAFSLPEATGMTCSGIPVEIPLPGGVQISERLGRSCDGPMATAATIVRSTLTAAVFVGGGIACLRGIGAGFGWRPSIGRQDGGNA